MKSLLFLLSLPLFAYADPSGEEKPSDPPSEEIALAEPNSFTSTKNAINPPFLAKPEISAKHKSSTVAVGLSALLPGLGSYYLGDYQTSAAVLGTTLVGTGLELSRLNVSEDIPINFWDNLAIVQNTWFYGIYAAYRDVRIYNKGKDYLYKMPTDSFSDLAKAPFRLSVLKKPEVWVGLLGCFALGATVSYFAFPEDLHIQLDTSKQFNPLCAFPVGIGEETFFRGYVQPLLSEPFSPAGGILLSSLIFGAAHFQNAEMLPEEHRWRYHAFIVPYISTLGAYFGYLTYKNNSLQESVAIHSWYDFAIFSATSVGTEAMISGNPKFAFAFTF